MYRTDLISVLSNDIARFDRLVSVRLKGYSEAHPMNDEA
jgi:hypothetical protein